jgi:uncharacterized phage protein gp47/JayE
MPIQYPTSRKEVVDRVKTDIQTELPNTAPFIRNSLLSALATGFGGSAYDLYKTIQQLEYQLFPDTATGDYAIRWGGLKNIFPKAATKAVGYINITGLAGSVIPLGSQLKTANAIGYVTNSAVTISTTNLNILSITRSGVTATVTTTSNHFYASGNTVTISGATQTAYNGTFVIVVTDVNKFTYTVSGSPSTPAIGTILATNTFAVVQVTASDFGSSSNQPAGASMTFASPIPGVNAIAFVTEEAIAGGSDSETSESYRARYIYAYQHPISFFNDADIENVVLTVPNVTRVFVEDITPAVGQVTIYFMTDNTTVNGIPTPTDVTNVINALLAIKPAHVDPADMIVLAPVADIIDFDFSALDPNTNSMKIAITNNLQQMFLEQAIVSEYILQDIYIAAIQNSVDLTTGESVKSFTLTNPTGDIVTAYGHIPVLGTVS